MLAETYSDEADLVREVNIYGAMVGRRVKDNLLLKLGNPLEIILMDILKYIPSTNVNKKLQELKEKHEERKRFENEFQLVPGFQKELEEARKYCEWKTLAELKI